MDESEQSQLAEQLDDLHLDVPDVAAESSGGGSSRSSQFGDSGEEPKSRHGSVGGVSIAPQEYEGVLSERLHHMEARSSLLVNNGVTQEDVAADAPPSPKLAPISSASDQMDPRKFRSNCFILSMAGKPVYSRHADDTSLVTFSGVLLALVSTVQDQGDVIRWISSADQLIVFSVTKHLILVGTSRAGESESQLTVRLNYMFQQVLMLITMHKMDVCYRAGHNYDLRHTLDRELRVLTRLWDLMDTEPSHLLCSVHSAPFPVSQRDLLATEMARSCKNATDMVFGILLLEGKLIALTCFKNSPHKLSPVDLQVLINLVFASVKAEEEHWVPVCLPHFDDQAFMYAYVAYLIEKCSLVLVLLSVEREAFEQLRNIKQKIVQRVCRHVSAATFTKSALVSTYSMTEVNIPQLWHFVYKDRVLCQYTSPAVPPYLDSEAVLTAYTRTHHLLHSNPGQKVVTYQPREEAVCVGWMQDKFEVYALFSPALHPSDTPPLIQALCKWVSENEARLFLLHSPTF